MKKLAIVGASHFVNRMFEACGNYQWTREFFKNAEEAGATKVEFGIEWQAVEKEGVYGVHPARWFVRHYNYGDLGRRIGNAATAGT
jgi:hypothetical protein